MLKNQLEILKFRICILWYLFEVHLDLILGKLKAMISNIREVKLSENIIKFDFFKPLLKSIRF